MDLVAQWLVNNPYTAHAQTESDAWAEKCMNGADVFGRILQMDNYIILSAASRVAKMLASIVQFLCGWLNWCTYLV